MTTQANRPDDLEARLRHSAPALREPDRARVARACKHLAAAGAGAPPVLTAPSTFARPLLRVAACLALMTAIALLMRPAAPSPGAAASTSAPSFESFHALTGMVVPQTLEQALTSEAEDLAADIETLTAALNDRTFAILF